VYVYPLKTWNNTAKTEDMAVAGEVYRLSNANIYVGLIRSETAML
jgi:hypothetical protein